MFISDEISRNRTTHKKLEKAIFQLTENYEVGMDYLSEIDEELSNELGDSMTYRNKSPFGRHFDSILQKSNSFVQNLQTRSQNICLEENSRYYLPNLPESVDFGFNDRNTLYANLSFMDWLDYWSYLIPLESKCYFYKLYLRKLDENRNNLQN